MAISKKPSRRALRASVGILGVVAVLSAANGFRDHLESSANAALEGVENRHRDELPNLTLYVQTPVEEERGAADEPTGPVDSVLDEPPKPIAPQPAIYLHQPRPLPRPADPETLAI